MTEPEHEAETPDARAAIIGLAMMCALGVVLGLATGLAVWWLHPEGVGRIWPAPTALGFSAFVMVVLYVTLARLAGRQAGDWLVVGYALAMLLLTGLVVTTEAAHLIHAHLLPSTYGVPRGAADGARALV